MQWHMLRSLKCVGEIFPNKFSSTNFASVHLCCFQVFEHDAFISLMCVSFCV